MRRRGRRKNLHHENGDADDATVLKKEALGHRDARERAHRRGHMVRPRAEPVINPG